MSMFNINLSDIERGQVTHQFTETGTVLLSDTDKVYFITETQASSSAAVTFRDHEGKLVTRTIASGRHEYFHPIVGKNFSFAAAVTEVSGFYVRV